MNIIEIFKRFPTEADCIEYLEQIRWQGTPICPYCNSDRSTAVPNEHRHHCNSCNTSFSVTVGTIFHHTHLPLQKWFLAISLILNAKKGIAARQLARDLEINKNTAWSLAMRVRNAMAESEQRDLLQGLVEMDETYVGGKPRKGHNDPKVKRGRGTKKVPVVGIIERGGNVRVSVARNRNLTTRSLSAFAKAHVDSTATLITDEYVGYNKISEFMPHKRINHSVEFANGDVHTNTIESFWSLFKRGYIGQYHQLSTQHLHRYFDEFCYRHNHKKHPDLFALTISRGLGVPAC